MGQSHHNHTDTDATYPTTLTDLLEGLRSYLPFPTQPDLQDDRPVDVRTLVLRALSDGPRNGGQILRGIRETGTDSGTTGAAEVYPELQLLVDDGLASVEETDGRRTFTLTDAGRAEADSLAATADSDAAGLPAPFDRFARLAEGRGELPAAGVKLGQAVHQAALSGTEDQRHRAAALLDETRRRIYGILAEDAAADADD